MFRFALSAFAALTLVGLLTGCMNPPDKEMSQAKAAIQEARSAGADVYATEDYKAAVTALRRSEEAVAQRDYRQALAFALDSRERALDARRAAGEQKAVARTEAERAVKTTEDATSQLRDRIGEIDRATTPKTRMSKAERQNLSEARRAIVVANVAVQKAREALTRGDYGTARQATFGVADHLQAVTATLAERPAPTPPRRRR